VFFFNVDVIIGHTIYT